MPEREEGTPMVSTVQVEHLYPLMYCCGGATSPFGIFCYPNTMVAHSLGD
jgi:hypothetical protein